MRKNLFVKQLACICFFAIAALLQLSFHTKHKIGTLVTFKHSYIDTTLPLKENGIGDYGATALVDIDHDGKLDFVMGGRQTATLYWYQYQSANHWIQHIVGYNYLADVGLTALDVDGDGWVDLVGSGVWYRNTGKPRTEPFERIMFDTVASGAHDIVNIDMDGDGKKDIVMMGDARSQLKGIYWYSIPTDVHQPWVKHYIGESIHGAIAPAGIADINGDGYPDVVRANTWFENKGGTGTQWIAHQNIPMGKQGPFGYCVRTAIADMDNNGKKVILRSPDRKGENWVKQALPQSFTYGSLHALAVADLNGDGLLDIIANEQEELLPDGRKNPRWIAWINQGNQQYKETILLDAGLGGHELQVGDVDGDGDIDICSKAWGTQPWNALGGKMHVDFLENTTKRDK